MDISEVTAFVISTYFWIRNISVWLLHVTSVLIAFVYMSLIISYSETHDGGG